MISKGEYLILDEACEWKSLGHSVSDITFAGDSIEGFTPYPAALLGERKSVTWSIGLDSYNIDPETLNLFYGDPDPRPRHSILFETRTPRLAPRHPRKGWPHTGKRYRQACRRWQRSVKWWKRGPAQFEQYAIYIPSARIEVL